MQSKRSSPLSNEAEGLQQTDRNGGFIKKQGEFGVGINSLLKYSVSLRGVCLFPQKCQALDIIGFKYCVFRVVVVVSVGGGWGYRTVMSL